MSYIEGTIISGQFNSEANEFAIEKVKDFRTRSVLNEKQISSLYYYIRSHQDDEDGQIVTLYDQMPVKLTQEETKQLLTDLEKIHSFL